MKKNAKEALILSSVAALALCLLYLVFVLEIPTRTALAVTSSPQSTSATVTLTVNPEIIITSPAITALSPSIYGITGNPGAPSSGTASFTVTTNDTGGYTISVLASTSPALQHTTDSTYSFADYTATRTYDWAAPSANNAVFAYTVEPNIASQALTPFKANGTVSCGSSTGTYSADKCWMGLSTTALNVITAATNTGASGETHVIKFYAEDNAKFLRSGTYQAVLTITATAF